MAGMRKKVEKELLDNYSKYYRLAYSYVRNESDAMDIVQEGAYKAMKEYTSINHDEYLSSWVYRIVINTALDFLRKKKKEIPWDEEEEMSYEDTYTDYDTLKLLDHLEEDDRIIIILRYFEDQKIEDIAKITGDNINTVKSKMYRALKKLKNYIEISETTQTRKVW